jgi:hypothetical protein
MSTEELQFYDLVLKAITAFIALTIAVAGVIKYFSSRKKESQLRREELAWKKTEFVFQLSKHFDEDKNIQSALQLIEFSSKSEQEKVQKILVQPVQQLLPDEILIRSQIDRYLDFFDRLYQFICITKTLSPIDAECFTWYIRRIGQVPILANYARDHGYGDLLTMYELFRPHFQTKEKINSNQDSISQADKNTK